MHLIIYSFIWIAICGLRLDSKFFAFLITAVILTDYVARYIGINAKYKMNLKLIKYLFWLVIEIVKSSYKLLVRSISHPPSVFGTYTRMIKAEGVTPEIIALYGSSITLTPGTITIYASNEELLVNAINDDDLDTLENPENEMLSRVKATKNIL
jgi:multisubunit Na+/H+ antiporter MnhE subunit